MKKIRAIVTKHITKKPTRTQKSHKLSITKSIKKNMRK